MTSYRTVMCFVVALGLSSGAALAQSAAPLSPLPMTFRQQVAFSDQEQKTIDAWVAAQVQRLVGTDVSAQTTARDTLVAQSNGSPAFADAYAKSLNDALAPVIQGNDFRAKLNAAVVAARVADKINTDRSNNSRLHDLSMLMLADKNDGIVLWGAKTAKSVVPAMFIAQGAAANPDLIKAVAQAALAKDSGPIVAEAYQTLAPRATGMPASALQPMVKATLPSLLQLMEARNKAYLTGVPNEPTAENTALLFLSNGEVWSVLSAQDKAAAMQQVSDLIGLAGQRFVASGRTDQDHLAQLLQLAGKALSVIATQPDVGSQELVTASTALSKVNASTPAADAQRLSSAIYPLLKKVSIFSSLNQPPTVNAGAATGPATAKTTP